MKKTLRNEDGTIEIPLNEQLKLIIARNENGFKVKDILLTIDENILKVEQGEEFEIKYNDMEDDEYLVNGDSIDEPQLYQLLYVKNGEMTGRKVFSSNGVDWHILPKK